MKNIIFFCLAIILISGCSNNKEKELCDKLDELDVHSYTEEEKYSELGNVLDKFYTTYCENSDSTVCVSLNDYLETTRTEIALKDCDNLQGNYEKICELDNKTMVQDKKIDVNYKHEVVIANCNNW